MWEIIRRNQRNSIFLIAGMGICLFALGAAMGGAWGGAEGLVLGLGGSGILWFVLTTTAYFNGDRILLSSTGAKPADPIVHQALLNIVDEMQIASGMPHKPKVFVIDDPVPNAFATGVRPEKSAIAVTAGLLGRLNRDELQGVIAHEMSHILNRDVLYMTLAGVMLGSMSILSHMFMRGSLYSRRSYRYSRNSKNDGGAKAILMILAIVIAIAGPILAQVFYFSLSRKREYLADASGARLTRYPEGLASALEKISSFKQPLQSANAATAPLYISSPSTQGRMDLMGIGHTHPPIQQRIQILRNMSGSGLNKYEESFRKTSGGAGLLPQSALKDPADAAIRPPSVETTPQVRTEADAARRTGDWMRAGNGFVFVQCACGLKVKLPAELITAGKIDCPSCHRPLQLPAPKPLPVSATPATVEGGFPFFLFTAIGAIVATLYFIASAKQ